MYNGHGYDYYNHTAHHNLRINTHAAVHPLPLDHHESNSSGMTPTPDTAILMSASYDRFQGGVGVSATASATPSAAAAATSTHAARGSDNYATSSSSAVTPSSATRASARSRTSAGDGSQHSSTRSRKLSQKEMLSRALQKANTAVELDNLQNFEGARRAYIEASELLNQVILRVGVDDVRRRLEEIRDRYTSRIEELDGMDQLEYDDEKELPARPERDSADFMPPMTSSLQFDDDGDDPDEMMSPRTTVTHATSTSISTPSSASHFVSGVGSNFSRSPGQTPVMLPIPERPHRPGQLNSAFSTSPVGANEWRPIDKSFLHRPEDEQYLPRPLSPYRLPNSQGQSPSYDYSYGQSQSLQDTSRLSARLSGNSLHARAMSQDSWLDHAGSGESTVSSLHSRASSMHQPSRQSLQMRPPIARSADFEFDAALDAAVEAAYDDPYEPLTPIAHRRQQSAAQGDDPVVQAMRKVEQAKERVRQTKMEASRLEQDRQIRERERELLDEDRRYQEIQSQSRQYHPHQSIHNNQPYSQDLPLETPSISGGDFFDDANSSDDEEQMLEEMSMGYKTDDFETTNDHETHIRVQGQEQEDPFGQHQPEAFAARTWFSTGTSAPTSATFLGSSPSEAQSQGSSPSTGPGQGPVISSPLVQSEPVAPPPDMVLPDLPSTRTRSRAPSSASQTVRNRRLSGQNPKQLSIETTTVAPAKRPFDANVQITEVPTPSINHIEADAATTEDLSQQNPLQIYDAEEESALEATGNAAGIVPKHPPTLAPPIPTSNNANLNVHSTPPMGMNEFDDMPDNARSVSPISSRVLRKNYSSTSLRSARTRNMSVSNIDDMHDLSPSTPGNSYMARNGHYPTVPPPHSGAFNDYVKNDSAEAVYFADIGLNHINSHSASGAMPISPRPGHVSIDPKTPVPLEPCPNDFMLRPFWLMRCLYQTLCHPCGGFVSNKLFVPRDAWKVKGVKLKNLDDKIAACDMLIVALERLSRVDTNDADLVLEEMQSLEIVLDQLTPQLARKLGGEVGVQTPGILFRESSASTEADQNSAVPRSTSVSGKSGSSFSWRRLRSKTSQAGLTSQYTSGGSVSANTRNNDSFTAYGSGTGGSGGMSKRDTPPAAEMLPMTMNPMAKPPRRDVRNVQFGGPNAAYMETLARLFDAAQTVDQIARQVEDPGLKHADKTQVGLELCTRHAAEFFAFYIVRFVMADLAHLLDKFIKRGTEWATA
ncbi:MIT (microtubule interacting and transport) domain protein [Ceratocystis platani]|uniref:MIT (Microtubule interacting and transport) domain protein n=1 Tax=Ceratocystis fimbriata f. sp. platani TaxID=88771 RepID=A0A0F8B5U1_CERFI|nr:MIT (microtubule interacting and transport) domain protein [Ceratocystis platani]